MAVYSFPANPIPSELNPRLKAFSEPWESMLGVLAVRRSSEANKLDYIGTISVPFTGSVMVKSFRLTGKAAFKMFNALEGARVVATLNTFRFLGDGKTSLFEAIAKIFIDRRDVASNGSSDTFDITVSNVNFPAASDNTSLAIQLYGDGQGSSSVYGVYIDM